MTYNNNTWEPHDLITSEKLNNIEDGVSNVLERITYGTGGAQQNTEPIHTPIYINQGDPFPPTPIAGDYVFVKDGDDFTIYEYVGVTWVKQIDPNLKTRLTEVLDQANTDAQSLVDQSAADVNAVLDDVKAKQTQLETEQAELDTKAQGYANQALADAKAGTQATAQQTAKDAQAALNNAETTLQQQISQKVSQADYDAKTGDLSLKVSTAQQTADQANTTIGNYKQTNDGRVASAESKIDQNAHDITTKVSQTDYDQKTGELSGEISSVRQTAGEINQSVANVQTQVNGLSVGGRNLYLNSRAVADSYGTNDSATVTVEPFDSATNMWHIVAEQGTGTSSGIYIWDYGNRKLPDNSDWSYSADVKGTGKVVQFGIELVNRNPVIGNVGSDWSRISNTGHIDTGQLKHLVMYFDTTDRPLDIYIKLPKLETGNMPTAWTPAPEDTADQISTVSQKVDSITSIVSDPTTGLSTRVQTAEGNISKVQSNIDGLQSKQTQTADGLTTEISDRKTGDANTLKQATDFTTSSIVNYDKGMQTQLTQTSDAIVAQVSTTGVRYVRVNGQGSNANNGTHIVRISLFDSSGADLLAGKTATLSGPNNPYFNGSSDANGATDGNINTFGYFYPEPNLNNFMVYDLGSVVYTPQRLEVKILATRTYKSVNVQVSPDGKAWRTVLLEDIKGLGSPDINVADTAVSLGGTSSATQLALLKDNWSLGIRDNTSALASGIAADPSAMDIVSPKVNIKSPQTQITGKLSANQIDVAELSAVSAKLGDVTSGSITNPVNIAKTGNSNAVIVGTTLIDSDGVTMNADILVGGSKVYTENVTINPDTGLGFKWVDASGNIVRNATINELGVVVGTGSGLTKTTITEKGTKLLSASGDITNVDVNGITASTWRTYTQTFSETNMDMTIKFTRQGHVVTASVNFVTYGATPSSDQAAMSGAKLAVGWRPQSRVELMLNANTSGNNPMLVTISIFPDGTVQKTAPNIDHQTRMLGSTTYQTFMTLPDSSHANMVSDAQGYLVL